MLKRLSGAIAAIALTMTGASAADLYRNPPSYAPAAIPYGYSWIGPYMGVNLGYQWGTLSNSGAKPNGIAGGFAYPPYATLLLWPLVYTSFPTAQKIFLLLSVALTLLSLALWEKRHFRLLRA